MSINDVMKKSEGHMQGAIQALHHEFKTLRTGRANAAMLDSVTVDYYGTPTPIAQAASVKVPEASMIVVEPWDKSMVAPVEKAIAGGGAQISAGLGLLLEQGIFPNFRRFSLIFPAIFEQSFDQKRH